ncbi:MAG TPA: primosomal protein N' [Balneolales bacterium]|nr:primosomal protein N' [Balneolales bacterium]
MPNQFADIAFPTAVREVFTYRIQDKMIDKISVGMRVWVPLQSHMAIGMVVRLHNHKPDFKTKDIARILDDTPVMSEEMLALTEWVHRFYYASWGETIQAALPVGMNFQSEKYIKPGNGLQLPNLGIEKEIIESILEGGQYSLKEAEKRWKESGTKIIKRLVKKGLLEIWEEPKVKIEAKKENRWNWATRVDGDTINEYWSNYSEGKQPKWVKALKELYDYGHPVRQSQISNFEFVNSYSLKRIQKEGLIKVVKVPVKQEVPDLEYDPTKIKTLNIYQKEAYDLIANKIDEEEFQNFLLFGVTGSGKTEVYIHALKKVYEQGKGGLVLVPEIALTPQTVRRFYQIFGDNIAVLHSRLSERERYDAWQDLQNGKKKIAIGARSAVYAPVKNPGIIIIDEEHDSSYKQEDPSPRYHAREVAIMRAYRNNAVVVMGSATPSMVSLRAAQTGKSVMLKLPSRHAKVDMPEVKVLDLKQYQKALRGPLAIPLYLDIEQALARNEQIILLYNRRGFANYLQCESCGHIEECPHCSVSLTYHKYQNNLRCHYCGYSRPVRHTCHSCGAKTVVQKGSGTQQVEEEISTLFPEARILRMDQDTTSGKDAHARILNKFGRKDADILIGTQIVAKGLDFPDVTVVGVVNADTELAFPSYRSGERMYQLLSQVAGRSGRSEKKGIVYFQTWQPEHLSVACARKHDYESFARQEMVYREELAYPPFSRILQFNFKSKDGTAVHKVAHAFSKCIVEAGNNAPVLGPSPSAITRVYNEYRWECLLKISPSNGANAIERLLDHAFQLYESKKPKGASKVRITVNVDSL